MRRGLLASRLACLVRAKFHSTSRALASILPGDDPDAYRLFPFVSFASFRSIFFVSFCGNSIRAYAFWRVRPTSARALSERGIIKEAINPSTAANDIQSPGMARFPVI
jgi:hypothetical protein